MFEWGNFMRKYIVTLFITYILIFFTGLTEAAQHISMISPMNGPITSDYGWRTHPIDGTQRYHSGVDIAGSEGQPIVAAADGNVTTAGWISGYGYTVIINHGYNISTLYGHNSTLMVSAGDHVRKGQVIALCGSTGNSTGPHCHFEVRENGEPVSPYTYCPVIGDGSYINGDAVDFDDIELEFDADYDYGKYLVGDEGFLKYIIKAASEGISVLQKYLIAIVVSLMTIDLALGAMFKTISPDESGSKILKWLVVKFIWFGMLMFLMTHWAELFGNAAKDVFLELGARMGGASEETIIAAFTDPTAVLQKGFHLIAPIFKEITGFSGGSVLGTAWSVFKTCILSGGPGPYIVSLGLYTIIFILLMALFIIITLQILYAFIQFYLIVLFSFVSFVFAGTKYTRHVAANGLNGLFSAFLSLMFFCTFSVIAQTTIQNISEEALFSDEHMTISIGGDIKNLNDFKNRIKQIESSGDYYAVNKTSGAFGAYQHMPKYWDDRCQKYVDAGGTLCLFNEHECPHPPGQTFTYSWCPENQEKVTSFCMENLYKKYGNWEQVACEWNFGSGDINNENLPEETKNYLEKLKDGFTSAVSVSVINIMVVFKLLIITLALIIFADRVHALIIKQFGGNGFRFTNE